MNPHAQRLERITSQAMGTGYAAEALTWAGTFHGIGARILREHALSIGLNPDFSIHDREDSADLLNLYRTRIGYCSELKDRVADSYILRLPSRCKAGHHTK